MFYEKDKEDTQKLKCGNHCDLSAEDSSIDKDRMSKWSQDHWNEFYETLDTDMDGKNESNEGKISEAGRLTYNSDEPYCCVCEWFDTCMKDGGKSDCEILGLYNKLKYYEDLEQQGRLLSAPCAVGDTVYQIVEGFVEPCTVEVIFIADYKDKAGNDSYMAEIHYDRDDCPYVSTEIYLTDIGKTVFLTPDEAEATLKADSTRS